MSIILNYNELVDAGEHKSARAHVLDILEAGLDSVMPHVAMRDFFKKKEEEFPDNVTVLGWGKASLGMFAAFRDNYKGDIINGSIIIPKGSREAASSEVEFLQGAHPLPDGSSVKSAERLLELARELSKDDTLVCLISGGGSSMFELPHESIELTELRTCYDSLLNSGADIHEMNAVRRALSATKGGRLAKAAYPASIINIVISDVIGNNLEDISSGPTALDPMKITPLEVVSKYNLQKNLGKKILDVIKNYKPPKPRFLTGVKTHIIADNERAVDFMAQKAGSLGLRPVRFKGYLTGEARREAGPFMNTPGDLVIGGGETTVTVKGKGRGGRNQEFTLAGLERLKSGVLCSIGSDGIDGNTDAAGALCDETVKERASKKNLNPKTYLANNDSYDFFRACKALVKTGPTGTNVADLCIYLKKY